MMNTSLSRLVALVATAPPAAFFLAVAFDGDAFTTSVLALAAFWLGAVLACAYAVRWVLAAGR